MLSQVEQDMVSVGGSMAAPLLEVFREERAIANGPELLRQPGEGDKEVLLTLTQRKT
jgi:hypothetical protein